MGVSLALCEAGVALTLADSASGSASMAICSCSCSWAGGAAALGVASAIYCAGGGVFGTGMMLEDTGQVLSYERAGLAGQR